MSKNREKGHATPQQVKKKVGEGILRRIIFTYHDDDQTHRTKDIERIIREECDIDFMEYETIRKDEQGYNDGI